MQLAFYFRTTRDLWIVAHCPNSNSINTNYLRETGASDILEGNSLDCINSLDEESFDVVIDTIGGSQSWSLSLLIPSLFRSLILILFELFFYSLRSFS